PASLIADVTAAIISGPIPATGLFHLTAEGQTNWHDFAQTIFESARRRGLLARVPRMSPITTADNPTPARRPMYSRLDTTALQQAFGIVLPGWRQGLEQVLDGLAEKA
ncbi:MAG: sugar nucleotide-binding protein, partial [Pseudoxanthomonas sp.]